MATGRRVSGRPGTGFVGLADWQGANASGASALADRLAGGVESAGNAAQQGLDNLESDYWDRVRGGTLRYDGEGLTSSQALAMGGRGYTGPNGLNEISGYEEAMGAADKAGQGARQVGDLYGRATALQDMAGRGSNYTTGQRLLDSALAGGAGGSRLQQLGAQWGGLLGRAQGMERAAASTAREAQAMSADAAGQYAAQAPQLRAQEQQRTNDAFTGNQRDMERQEDARERRMRENDPARRSPRPPGTTPGRKGADEYGKGWGGGGWA